jgi:hypothetical protein
MGVLATFLMASTLGAQAPNPYPPYNPNANPYLKRIQEPGKEISKQPRDLHAAINSGQAANELLTELKGFQKQGIAGPPVALDTKMLQLVNLTKSNGHIGYLRNADKLEWPTVLQGANFATDRKQITALLLEASKQAQKGKVDAKVLEDLGKVLNDLNQLLKDQITEVTASQYIEGKRFLINLGMTVEVLQDKACQEYFAIAKELPTKAKTVTDLVRYMTEKNLKFAPCLPGDNATYRDLYQAMDAYAEGARTRPKKG